MLTTRATIVVCIVVCIVLFGACEGRRLPTTGDGSTSDVLQRCACDPKLVRQRCVGATPEACVDGQWVAGPACTTQEVCAAGACRADGATGCPDTARYDGNQAVRER